MVETPVQLLASRREQIEASIPPRAITNVRSYDAATWACSNGADTVWVRRSGTTTTLDVSSRSPRGPSVDRIHDLAFDATAHRLAVATGRYLWGFDLESGDSWTFQGRNFFGFLINAVLAVAWVENGWVASFTDGTIQRFDTEGHLLGRTVAHDTPRRLVGHEGEILGIDRTVVSRWALTGRRLERTSLLRFPDPALGFELRPDRIVRRTHAEVQICDLSGSRLAQVPAPGGLPLVALPPITAKRGERIAIACEHAVELRSWQGDLLAETEPFSERITGLAWSPDDHLLIGCRDGTLSWIKVPD